ncbi:hypothetical protein [Rossellomorea marisflavi]|uniref:hypothetical protein n=1 Tax=Rossellomorea marisflavi TaxID=189381 RepID=UPI003FA06BE3
MSKDYDLLISQAEGSFEELKTEMEEVRLRFKLAVIPYVKEWINETARNEIKTNSELVSELGVERLKQLKEEVGALIEEIPSRVDHYLDNSVMWWHMREPQLGTLYGGRIPSDIQDAIKYIFGELGVILSKDGFVSVKTTSSFDRSYTSASWNHNGKPMYPYGIVLPKSIETVYGEYGELIKEGQKKATIIKDLKKEKEQNNIVELWDSL